jgi:hypothetical protein
VDGGASSSACRTTDPAFPPALEHVSGRFLAWTRPAHANRAASRTWTVHRQAHRQNHGGKVWARSEPGKGAAFSSRCPSKKIRRTTTEPRAVYSSTPSSFLIVSSAGSLPLY